MTIRICCLIVSIILVLIGGRVSAITETCSEAQFVDLLNQYYSAEISKKWERTYSMRDSRFKEIVPLDNYKKIMKQDSIGWKYINFTIVKYKVVDNRAAAHILFEWEPPAENALSIFKKFLDKSIKATCENDNWVLLETGFRGHLTMNREI